MFLEDVKIVKVGNTPSSLSIQAGINQAASQGGNVVISSDYAGTDSIVSNTAAVNIIDLRPTNAANFSGGEPALIGTVRTTFTATAAAANFNAYTQVAGVYRVTGYLLNGNTIVTSGAVVTIGYTNSIGATSAAFSTVGTAAAAAVSGQIVLQSAGTAAITYSVTAFGTVTANLVLERLA